MAKKTVKAKSTSHAKAAAKAPQKTAAKQAAKPAAKAPEKQKISNEQRIKHALKKLTGSSKATPNIFKLPTKKHTPVAFSLSEVRDLLKEKAGRGEENGKVKPVITPKPVKKELLEPQQKPRLLKKATLDDLLGIKQERRSTALDLDEKDVSAKFLPYYKKLKALRERLAKSVEERSEQTLRSSSKDAAGDLSSYSQHIADAGTDAFDYDFALSLVSSDQEMLKEVDAAIQRIADGTYGVCEVTHKPIGRDRLNAVPFTRFSKEGQEQFERTRRRSSQRIGIASSEDDEEIGAAGGDDDAGES